jgi:hypothetical protein
MRFRALELRCEQCVGCIKHAPYGAINEGSKPATSDAMLLPELP